MCRGIHGLKYLAQHQGLEAVYQVKLLPNFRFMLSLRTAQKNQFVQNTAAAYGNIGMASL